MNALSQKTFQDLCMVPVNALGGFAVGCVAGALLGAPVIVTGAWLAINAIANKSINLVVNELAVKYNWKPSSVVLVKTVSHAAINGAALAASVALGIFGPTGVLILGAILTIGFLNNCHLASQVRGEEARGRRGIYTKNAAPILNA